MFCSAKKGNGRGISYGGGGGGGRASIPSRVIE